MKKRWAEKLLQIAGLLEKSRTLEQWERWNLEEKNWIASDVQKSILKHCAMTLWIFCLTSVYLQKSASIEPWTSLLELDVVSPQLTGIFISSGITFGIFVWAEAIPYWPIDEVIRNIVDRPQGEEIWLFVHSNSEIRSLTFVSIGESEDVYLDFGWLDCKPFNMHLLYWTALST